MTDTNNPKPTLNREQVEALLLVGQRAIDARDHEAWARFSAEWSRYKPPSCAATLVRSFILRNAVAIVGFYL